VGYEQVYRNGVLLSRGNDYTATNGTTVTLIDATIAGDIIEIFANELVPLSDAISKGQFTAKGSLLSASAASTPAVLAVGSNDQVLTADSSTTTGLKWAAPSSGGMTLISTTTLSGASITLSSIPSGYVDLRLYIRLFLCATSGQRMQFRFNGDANTRYAGSFTFGSSQDNGQAFDATEISTTTGPQNSSTTQSLIIVDVPDYANTSTWKTLQTFGVTNHQTTSTSANYRQTFGFYNQTSAISSITLFPGNGNFTSGTVLLYGVK
jgi:hypothetical protein